MIVEVLKIKEKMLFYVPIVTPSNQGFVSFGQKLGVQKLMRLFINYSKKLKCVRNVEIEDTIDAIKQIIEILDSKIIEV